MKSRTQEQRMFGHKSIPYALSLAMIAWMSVSPCLAIPAFSRKHGLSCSMCHSSFPQLNKYGRDFATNSFKSDEENFKHKTYKDIGDDNLFLLKDLPLAIRTEMYFDFATRSSDETSDEFKVPWALQLLSGGDLGYDIAYYVSFFVGEFDQQTGIEQALLRFNNLFGSNLDLIVGQFQMPFGIFRHNLRPTFQDYLFYKVKPGESSTALSYDRGIAFQYWFDMGLELTASISNGSGLGEGELAENFDIDRFKHFSVHLTQRLGPVRLGLFAYYGKEELTRASDGQKWNNELNLWGPDISLAMGKAELNLQYIQRRDIKPTYGTTRETSPLFSQGFIAQAIANVLNDPAQMQVVLLFNYVDSDDPKIRQEAYSANISYLLLTNLKLVAEYTFARVRDGLEANEHRITVGVLSGI